MPPASDIAARAREILAKPGFITGADATELREYLDDTTEILLHNLDQFGHICLSGDLETALTILTAEDINNRPNLTWKQQRLGHTYAAVLVVGYTTCESIDDGQANDYMRLLDVLLSAGVFVDSPDITGKTALHHAAESPRGSDPIKVLLKHKANVDSQDRFGASPLLIAIQEYIVDVIPTLLNAGADLNITDGEGRSPRSMYPTCPAEVSSVVGNWIVQHKGKGAVLQGDRCGKCGTKSSSVRRCSRCRSKLYCSPGCQRVDWKEHKQSCQPFEKEENLLVVTPTYTHGASSYVSTISVVPSSFGDTRGSIPVDSLKRMYEMVGT